MMAFLHLQANCVTGWARSLAAMEIKAFISLQAKNSIFNSNRNGVTVPSVSTKGAIGLSEAGNNSIC